jgi:hypothetical protein
LDVANTHNNIGTDLKNLAKWDKSMQHFKRVLDIAMPVREKNLTLCWLHNPTIILGSCSWFKVK